MVPHHSPATHTDLDTEKPIDRVLSRISAKRYSKGYLAHCPAHRDAEESLTIWEDERDEHVGIKCYAGCTRKAIVEAIGLTEQDLYRQDGLRAIYQVEPGITVLDLAVAKRIHPNFLINLGIVDMTYRGRDAVRISYQLLDGSLSSRYRIRTALRAKEGSRWNKGDAAIIPYGLHRLSDAQKAGYLILVEGESDCWTLWSYGYPALGIPGAALYTCLKPEYLQAIPHLYVMQEPWQRQETLDTARVYRHSLGTQFGADNGCRRSQRVTSA
jgi:putative DNA primase/helicase